MKIAVIGAGPAGFYTAGRLLEKLPKCKIDMFDSLPVPFGLSRFGVAPDHPEVKNCQEKFEETARHKDFHFYGHVDVGKDISLKKLKESYNALVLAYGASEDRMLGIPGENLKGVFSARQFVGWYNGVPSLAHIRPPLDMAEDVVVVGLGNVALDVARMLLCDVSRLKSTDVSEQAYEVLKTSKVKNVRIVGRRGLLQSAFTTKEVRELIEERGVLMKPLVEQYIQPYRPFIKILERPKKRLVDLLDKTSRKNDQLLRGQEQDLSQLRTWSLDYLLSPKQFYGSSTNPDLLSSVKFGINSLDQADLKAPANPVPTGETINIKSELAFRSIGYKPMPLPGFEELGIPFSTRQGHIPNLYGRIVGEHGNPLVGLYVSGWVKNGPTGVIAQTMFDSFEVAETIVEDLNDGKLDTEDRPGFAGIKDSITSNRVVTWDDWQKLDAEEIRRGKDAGKTRSKFDDVDEMIGFLDGSTCI